MANSSNKRPANDEAEGSRADALRKGAIWSFNKNTGASSSITL
jgi:hypothetical protein